MKKLCLGLIAACALNISSFAAFQFSSVTTYSQEQPVVSSFSAGLVTHIHGNLPMAVDLANVNEATSFRINGSTMWQGGNFQVLLGQDPNYKPGATKAAITTTTGTVQLSWTATNVTFSGTLIDSYSTIVFPGFPFTTPIPLGIPGPFTSNTTLSVHFQYTDYSHTAVLTGTNKLVTYLVTNPPFFPGDPPTTSYNTVNTGQFSITADLIPPTIKFNSPAQNTVITSSDVNINLTVSDNVALGYGPIWLGAGSVLSYTINGAATYGDADTFPGGPTTHALNLNGLLNPGTNVLTFIAADSSGNLGTNTIVLFFSEKTPITLATNGVGSITGITNRQPLETGRNYIITAKPGAGQTFAGWVDGSATTVSRSATYTFSMYPGLILTATFADNPYPAVQGTYLGFFQPSFAPTAKQFGGLKMTVSASGSFSGTLTSGAGAGTFSGQFLYNSTGTQDARVNVLGKATNTMFLTLVTDSNLNNFGTIQGTVLLSNGGGISSVKPKNVVLSADVSAGRVTNASVLPGGAGTYHFVVNAATNDVNFPGGNGFGTLTVAANGTVTGSISMADGDAPTTTFSSQLVYTGYLPVFVPLYNKGGGFLMAPDLSMVPTDGTATNATTATWVKSAGKAFYPNGFSTGNDVYIARYTAVPSGTPFGSINIELDPDVLINESLGRTNTAFGLSSPDPSNVKGSFTPAGAVSGSFVDNSVNRTFKGLVLETLTSPNFLAGAGFFVRSNQTGSVTFSFAENP